LGDKIEKINMSGTCSKYVGEVHTGFWWGNLRERDHLEDQNVNGMIILRRIFRRLGVGAWTGLIWLIIGTGGGLL
jgi:hypothetical protein